ncbi:VOC family protein [Cellulosimicrobium funkei]|nr:VOC family protein [Cellulosimicrobium funkei]
MSLRWYSTVVESTDHRALAQWWATALDWKIAYESDLESVVIPRWSAELTTSLPFHRVPPGMVFVPVKHQKSGKNRLHWDFAPHTTDDRDAEIHRLVTLGATLIDVGEPDEATWTVLADPDGNEFCVLSARDE